MDTAAWYRWFAENEAAGSSPSYERLAHGIADDPSVVRWLEQLPAAKRQPNLLFATARYLGGPTDTDGFFEFVRDRHDDLTTAMSVRSTQTNEAARCAAFVPVLAELEAPVALIEVGASAGLCLFPDRYAYRFDDARLGDSPLEICVDTGGSVPAPTSLPTAVWRRGLDLDPLDLTSEDDLAWLRACIWPEHEERRRRLDLAAELVANDPPRIDRGDLRIATRDLLDAAPRDAVKVVFHSAVLAYLDDAGRREFTDVMRRTLDERDDVVWLSNEGPSIVALDPLRTEPAGAPSTGAHFRLGRDGTELLAITDPHGRWLRWQPPG